MYNYPINLISLKGSSYAVNQTNSFIEWDIDSGVSEELLYVICGIRWYVYEH